MNRTMLNMKWLPS